VHKGKLDAEARVWQIRKDKTGEAGEQVRRAIPELLLSWHHPVSGQKQRTEHARLGHVPPSSLSDSCAQHPLPSLPSPDPANQRNTHSSICQLLLLRCTLTKEVGTCCHERLLVTKLSHGQSLQQSSCQRTLPCQMSTSTHVCVDCADIHEHVNLQSDR